jgi:hypothetical protein
MKETTTAAMPPCFERWFQRFDDVFTHKAQKREFRHYLGGLLGESARKNLFQMASNAIEVTYHQLHHFLTVIVDAGYGNNTSFLLELEKRQLKYLGGLAKNRKVIVNNFQNIPKTIRLDELAQTLPQEDFTEIQMELDKPKTLWVVTLEVEISGLTGKRNIAIVMNASTFSEATDIDYFITNTSSSIVTPQWIVDTYSQRNWVEVFYRGAPCWLGFKEYQIRDKRSLLRHFILVFCAYTFILWHQLTGGLRRRWANKSLKTFTEAIDAFRTAIYESIY